MDRMAFQEEVTLKSKDKSDRRARNLSGATSRSEDYEVENRASADRSDRKGVKGKGRPKVRKGGKQKSNDAGSKCKSSRTEQSGPYSTGRAKTKDCKKGPCEKGGKSKGKNKPWKLRN